MKRIVTKKVNFNQKNIEKLPNDKPVLYKIQTQSGGTNYAGTAQKSSQSASKTFITAFPTEKRWPFENMLPVIEHSFNNEDYVRFSEHL